MAITPIWLQPPSFQARKRKLPVFSTTIPLTIIQPSKAIRPNIPKVDIIPSYAPFMPKITLFNQKITDKPLGDSNYGFITNHTYENNKARATLTLLDSDELKEMIVNPDLIPSDMFGVVRVTEGGDLTPASIPDFGDFATFPRAFRVLLKWLFENSERTLKILQDLWISCSPILPSRRNEAHLSFGTYSWHCHSMSSRHQLFKVRNPSSLDINISSWCSDATFNTIDGRNYEFKIECHENLEQPNKGSKFCSIQKSNVQLVIWNCQGVGRDSFRGNLKHIIEAHKPDIVILFETRTSKQLLKTIIHKRSCNKIDGISSNYIFGGMAVLSLNKEIEFVKVYELSNGIGGSIKGIAP